MNALLKTGNYAELESLSSSVLANMPDAGPVWHMFAIALAAQEKDAMHAFENAVRLMPGNAGANVNLGVAWMDRGNVGMAMTCFQRALSISPDSVELLNKIAASLANAGQRDEALHCYYRITMLAPALPEAHRNFANALLQSGRFHQAIASYQRVMELAPEDDMAVLNLGDSYKAVGKAEEALVCYRRVAERRPDSVDAHVGVATILRLQGRADEAERYCAQMLVRFPDASAILSVLGQALADQGRFSEAEVHFRTVIRKEPRLLQAWDGLAYMRKMTIDDAPLWAEAEQIAAQLTRPGDESFLRYAIAKYHDDTGNYEHAFRNYQRANELGKLIRPPHSRAELTRSGDSIICTYDRAWLERHRNYGNKTLRPVFVVGMMRSGTTLAEQILASHPAVHGAGELAFWSAAFEQHNSTQYSGDAGRQAIERLAREHDVLLESMSVDAQRVVDKTPINFVCLGLIHAALPGARIIHMVRNPIDTCLSIYFQNFESTISYANDLEDLAHCYREYRRLMNHWRSVLPEEVMLEVPYEALVEDPGTWSRKMVEFLGLDWHDDCLRFYKTSRAVVTASRWQVRQKIYKSSMQRWRNYEKFIGPLLSLVD